MKGTIIQIKHGVGKIEGEDGKRYKFNKKTTFLAGDSKSAKRLQKIVFEPDGAWAADIQLLDEFEQPSPRQEPASQPQRTERAEGCRFLNPYNFVRFIDQERLNNDVLGNAPPPPHDRYVGLTGQIVCSLEAVTPLFVSDSHAIGKQRTKSGKDHFTYRFFEYDGKPAIPATSLRGMVRSVFETVTNSCMSIFEKDEPYPLECRPTRLPDGYQLIPIRIVDFDNSGNALCEILDAAKTRLPHSLAHNNKPVIPTGAVTRAYRHRVIFKDSQTHTTRPFFGSNLPNAVKNGERVVALVKKRATLHRSKRYQFFEVVKVASLNQQHTLSPIAGQKIVYGWIHITGPNIERKHDERLFFRWDDTTPIPITDFSKLPPTYQITITKEIVQEYNHHLAEYWERHKNWIASLGNKPWPKTVDALPHPSSFIERNRKLKKGDLVYAIGRYEYGRQLPNVKSLRPVSIPRIRYQYERQTFLANSGKHLLPCQSFDALCPACRTFGWVYQPKKDEKTKDLPEITAYAGRVRFQHAMIEGTPATISDKTLTILGSPKPTTTKFYLLNANGRPDKRVDYDSRTARLRGRKFYRHHGEWEKMSEEQRKRFWQEAEKAVKRDDPDVGRSDQNRTIKGALQPGNKFTFTVDFENLAPKELGALLFALELEDGMFHRIGYGKPLGFGSIRVTVKQVRCIDWKQRLSTLEADTGWTEMETAPLIQSFIEAMRDQYPEQFDQMLADLRALLSAPAADIPIHYPRPTKDPSPDGKQFEWFVGNNRRGRNAGPHLTLDLADEDTHGLPLVNRSGNIVE